MIVTHVCTSERRGTPKRAVTVAQAVAHAGLEGDAHAGALRRQVSLLAEESVDKMRRPGLSLDPGAFGENIDTRGVDLLSLAVGTRLRIGSRALFEVTQHGKVCHDRCAIYEAVGDCVMPREGIFVEVIEGGPISPGDEIVILDSEDDA